MTAAVASMAAKQHEITLLTRDGQRRPILCGEEENLLAAATRQGLTLPSLCREGSCGACHARALEGEYQLGPHSTSALSAEARERGEILLCRTAPRGPLTIVVEQDLAAMEAPAPTERSAEIVALERLTDDTVRLELQLSATAEGSGIQFEPGQYVTLTLPAGGVTRAYSIANTANWEGRLEFLIRRQPNGRFAHWLASAQLGEPLQVCGPNGSFVLDEASLSPRWFVAGGTGLAPILSMLRWMGELQAPQPARLYFGVNDESQLFAMEVLRDLQLQLPQLQLEICLWRPQGEWQGFVGTPLAALERDLPEALARGEQPDLYLCGPPALVTGVEQLATSLGLAERLRSERFLPN